MLARGESPNHVARIDQPSARGMRPAVPFVSLLCAANDVRGFERLTVRVAQTSRLRGERSKRAVYNMITESRDPQAPERRPPVPPFTRETARDKVRLAEDGWNTRDPERISRAYTSDSVWRNRNEFLRGRQAIVEFLTRKWARELDYRLIKELWTFGADRIAVRFAYEWHDATGQWFRSYGNENWAFDASGLMAARYASINDLEITESDRHFRWDRSGPRPPEHAGLSDLDL